MEIVFDIKFTKLNLISAEFLLPSMLCTVLGFIAALIILSIILRRSWLTIFTFLFIFAFFIILGLVSIVPLGSPDKDNIFDPNAYVKCYVYYKTCGQNLLNKVEYYFK